MCLKGPGNPGGPEALQDFQDLQDLRNISNPKRIIITVFWGDPGRNLWF